MRAVNLIPSDERRGPGIPTGRSGGAAYVVLGLLGGLAVCALLYGRADHQISSRRAEVVSLNVRAQQAQARAGELSPYTSFLQMREQRVQAVSQLVDSRFDWAQAFQELGRVLPANKVSLSSLDGTVGSSSSTSSSGSSASAASGSSVTSATPPGSIPTFSLTGCATSQAEVALMLDRLRLIDGVNEVTLQSSTESGAAGGGGGGGAGCEGDDVSFSVQVTFDALPSVSATGGSGAASTVSAAATSPASTAPAAASTTPAPTTPAPASTAGEVR
jgi:Tfp pilus assembly protein PilN